MLRIKQKSFLITKVFWTIISKKKTNVFLKKGSIIIAINMQKYIETKILNATSVTEEILAYKVFPNNTNLVKNSNV